MKRTTSVIIALLLFFALSACNSGENTANTSSTLVAQTDAATEMPETSAASSSPTDAPEESPEASNTFQADSGDEIIDITEKMYVTYINEIYINTEDYLGKTVCIEGMFTSEYYEPTDTTYYYVYRVGPGCCGNDGSMCGFEFSWDSADTLTDNDWIEVVGILDSYEEDGYTFLTLRAQSVTVKDERGEETVYQ